VNLLVVCFHLASPGPTIERLHRVAPDQRVTNGGGRGLPAAPTTVAAVTAAAPAAADDKGLTRYVCL
jgi:hypothetical protein